MNIVCSEVDNVVLLAPPVVEEDDSAVVEVERGDALGVAGQPLPCPPVVAVCVNAFHDHCQRPVFGAD